MKQKSVIAIIFLLSILSLTPTSQASQKNLFYFGGGGESEAKLDTIFDNGLEILTESTSSRKWNIETVFNGGHSNSEELAKRLKLNNRPFTKKTFNNQIEKIKSQIQNNSYKNGDQILIVIDTHGLQNEKQTTHDILSNDGRISLDVLKEIQKLAKDKNIKLAIMDMSCYSGNLMALDDGHSCLISGSDKETLGYNISGESIFTQMKMANNLEEAFLRGRFRSISGDLSRPEINTPLGKSIAAKLSLFNVPNKINDKLIENPNNPGQCDASDINKLKSQVVNIMKTINNKSTQNKLIKDLDFAIKQYTDTLKNAQTLGAEISKLGEICSKVDGVKLCYSLANFYPDKFVEDLVLNRQRQNMELDSGNPRRIKAAKEKLKTLQRSEAFYNAIQSDEKYKNFISKRNHYIMATNRLSEFAEMVIETERKTYANLYAEGMKKETSSNPCRDFKL